MFLFTQPSQDKAKALLAKQVALPFTYAAVGATATTPPKDFDVDRNRVQVGHGEADFLAACAAVRRWTMFDLGWIDLLWPIAPLVEGTTVGVVAHLPSVHILNACRIVYVINEQSDIISRFGFAYGTLPGHIERGEERFLVEWNRHDDTVCYEILAFSQPRHWLVKLGYPIARLYQRRFVRDSLRRMHKAVLQKEFHDG